MNEIGKYQMALGKVYLIKSEMRSGECAGCAGDTQPQGLAGASQLCRSLDKCEGRVAVLAKPRIRPSLVPGRFWCSSWPHLANVGGNSPKEAYDRWALAVTQ
jgi:hypothetical protein